MSSSARQASRPEVTVLLPAARVDRYLETALDSVLNQSEVDLEVHLLLDGCTGSALPRAALDQRVKVYPSDRRLGVARTLNRGLAQVSSPFIARMDADDVSYRDRFTAQLSYLERNPAVSILGTAANLINESGQRIGDFNVLSGPPRLTRALLLRNRFIHPTIMARTKVLQSLGGYNERCMRVEDYELWLRASTMTELDNLPASYLDYRIHTNQWGRSGRYLDSDVQLLLAARVHNCRGRGMPLPVAYACHVVWLAGRGGKLLLDKARKSRVVSAVRRRSAAEEHEAAVHGASASRRVGA